MSEKQTRHETRHEQLRKEQGPTSRRRRALGRLRSLAGRYRKRYVAAAALAGALAVALVLVAAGTFGKDDAVTLGTGRAGVMADTARTADDAAETAPASQADSLAQARAQREQATAEADNTTVVEEAAEEVAELIGRGEASYYGAELAGNPTASGEIFDPAKLTAAHRTLPLGSRVRVTNLRNDETVVVRINDRGPYHGRRILDLSRRAAQRIGMIARGKARVKIELLEED